MSRRDQYARDFGGTASTGGSWLTTSLLVGLISLAAGGAGFVMPQFINGGAATGFSWQALAVGQDASRKPKHKTSGQQAFIPFGDAVVNLADERLTRHLQVRITLLAHGADEASIQTALENNRAVLMNWLISYLSDKSLEDVRGAAGMNRARRDIQDRFNQLLFADGSERIRDVLFEEFTVR